MLSYSDIQIGTKVVIAKSSGYYEHQFLGLAKGTIGTVVLSRDYYPADSSSSWIYVKFANGYGNCYKLQDLKLVDQSSEARVEDVTCPSCGTVCELVDKEENLYECPSCLLIDFDEGVLYNVTA